MKKILYKYFYNIKKDKIYKFHLFYKLHIHYGKIINLVSKKSIKLFYINHILHSLSIIKFFKFSHKKKILDLGTGGGLPGIPLAIMLPYIKFNLVDSIKKKCYIVDKMVKKLNLSNVDIKCYRINNIIKNNNKFDYIICRGINSNMHKLYKL